jgi:hypothetical protein
VKEDAVPAPLITLWTQTFEGWGLTQVDVAAGVAKVFAVKDNLEQVRNDPGLFFSQIIFLKKFAIEFLSFFMGDIHAGPFAHVILCERPRYAVVPEGNGKTRC